MSFICHIHNYTEYNEEWNVFSAFNPSKCTQLEQWAADCAAPGEQSWTSCRSRDLNPQPWVTSGFKSNALSSRPRLPLKQVLFAFHLVRYDHQLECPWAPPEGTSPHTYCHSLKTTIPIILCLDSWSLIAFNCLVTSSVSPYLKPGFSLIHCLVFQMSHCCS